MCVTFREPLKSLTVDTNETEMLVRRAINRDFGLGTPKYRESCPAIATPLFRVPEGNTCSGQWWAKQGRFITN